MSARSEWLLDTSTFYWAGSPGKKDVLQSYGATLTTSVTSALEILAGMRDTDSFSTRRRALVSLRDLCGLQGILRPDTDGVVAAAFGTTTEPFRVDQLWEAVELACTAESWEAVELGMAQPLRARVLSVNLRALREWDENQGAYFKQAVDRCYSDVEPELIRLARPFVDSPRKAEGVARLAESLRARSPQARATALVGLAARAGFVQSRTLERAVAARDTSVLQRITDEVAVRYDGSIDFFLKVYQEYHATCALERRAVGQNDYFDLDPMLYMRSADFDQKYVSGEDFLVRTVRAVSSDRGLDVKELVRSP